MLNISTYCNTSSYSLVGLNILKSLIDLGYNPSLFPIGPPNNQEPSLISHLQQGIKNAQNFDYEAPSLHINHQWMLANHRVGNGKKYGMTFFEVDSLTPLEIRHINYLDVLFVPTEWCKSVVDSFCSVKTYVTGLGVDLSIFHPTKTVCNKKITNFLYIGKASKNKGTDFAIHCFEKAFQNYDNVRLYLSIDNPFDDMKKWFSLIKTPNKYKIVNRLNTQQDLAKLINSIDCLLAVSRAESWNLPVLETMACGKPVILTKIGGHENFYTPNNYVIKINDVEPAHDGIFFKHGPINQGNWAKLDKDEEEQCIGYLREVHYRNINNGIGLCQNNIDKAKEFSWEKCVKKMLKGIN